MASRILIPFTAIATTSAEVDSKVAGRFSYAFAGFGGPSYLGGESNGSYYENRDDFNQFASANPSVFVAGLSKIRHDCLIDLGASQWGYRNLTDATGGILVSNDDLIRDALVRENPRQARLFNSLTDYTPNVGGVVSTQRLVGTFDQSDIVEIIYQVGNALTTPTFQWRKMLFSIEPFLTGGFDNSAIQSVSEAEFQIKTGAGALFTDAGLVSRDQAFEIWRV